MEPTKYFNLESRVRRFSFFLLIILANFGLFINKGLNTIFNNDEPQHTYLAWSSLFFNKTIFKDNFDNHGFLYNLLNQAYLFLFHPAPGISTLLELRSLAIILLAANLFTLFELLWQITSSVKYTILAPIVISLTEFSNKAIEIRPDMLLAIFSNLTLIFLVIGFKTYETRKALLAGVFATCMVFTNVKSVFYLSGIFLGLLTIFLFFSEHRKTVKLLFFNLILGILITLCAGLGYLLSIGALSNYLKYCLAFNVNLVTTRPTGHIWSASLDAYLNNTKIVSLLLITSLVIWIASIIRSDYKSKPLKIFFAVIMFAAISGKCFGFWLQYDLIFIFPLAALSSWFIYSCANYAILRLPLIANHYWIIPGLMITYSIANAWSPLPFFKNETLTYLKSAESRYEEISHAGIAGETVEAFNLDCLAFGFVEHASYMILKDAILMEKHERIEGKTIYDKNYINLLNQKKSAI